MSYYSMRDAMQVRRDMKFQDSKKGLPYVINHSKRTKKGKKKK